MVGPSHVIAASIRQTPWAIGSVSVARHAWHCLTYMPGNRHDQIANSMYR